MPSVDSRPRRADAVLSQRAEDTVVLLHPASGEYFALDEIGCRVWELSDGTRTIAEMARALASEYDASEDEIAADVMALVRDLRDASLVAVDA